MKQLPENFSVRQWVCVACGYNMIGEQPDVCPFCGATHDKFARWDEVEAVYQVTKKPVTEHVSQLLSVPRLGLEHAAYRIETTAGAIWIDSPSAFNRILEPVTDIYFTHMDFLGASNQYRALWNARVHPHKDDARHPLVAAFTVDDRFSGDFRADNGIEAFHIGGHSPGWTAYLFGEVLFACDYAFPPGPRMRLNPFGPGAETRERGGRLLELVAERKPAVVCGHNYVVDGGEWRQDFEAALKRAA